MQGNTHRFGGILFGAAVSAVSIPLVHIQNPIPVAGVMMMGGAIGSLIPDIDHEGSLIGRKMKPVSHVVRKVCGHRGYTHTLLALFVYSLACMGLSKIIVHACEGENSFNNKVFLGLITALVLGSATLFILNKFSHLVTRKEITKIVAGVALFGFIGGIYDTNIILHYVPIYLIGSMVGYLSHLFLDMLTVTGVPLFKPFTDHMFRIAKLRTGEVEGKVSAVCIFLTFVCLFFICK